MNGANFERGKRGLELGLGFCSVLVTSRGIRRDIEITAKPKLRRKADLLRKSLLMAGNERAQFGAIHAALVTLVLEQPHNTSGIEAAALVLHEWTQDPFFVVEGHLRTGGVGTDYTKLDVATADEAREQIAAMPAAQMIQLMQVIKGVAA